MDKVELKRRLKQLAINTAKLCMELPFNSVNKVYSDQIIRSSSSSASNYFAACRGKSKADFINKLRTVEEELDETLFFYEMLAEFNEPFKKDLRILYKEGRMTLSKIRNLKSKIQNHLDEHSETK
jgi:four helix bundle protein